MAGGLHSDADENSVLLGCFVESLGQHSLTFCIEVLPSSSGALFFSETSGNANPASSSHILEDLGPLPDDLEVKIAM